MHIFHTSYIIAINTLFSASHNSTLHKFHLTQKCELIYSAGVESIVVR